LAGQITLREHALLFRLDAVKTYMLTKQVIYASLTLHALALLTQSQDIVLACQLIVI